MNNYKIRVNNEAESREAQELFFELGAKWRDAVDSKSIIDSSLDYPFLVVVNEGFLYLTTNSYEKKEELTLPQLRDLVVLHRNDVKDATHTDNYHDGTLRFFMTSDGDIYIYETNGFQRGWIRSGIYPKELKLIQKSEQGLISGADALRALADGEEVEALVEFELGLKKWHDARDLPICDVLINGFDFRLKPRTIKLELEIPAPFEPKVGEEYYYPYPHSERGYALDVFKGGRITNQFGAWRKEAEIKIVVEQLRKSKEHSK
ncbi:hypothetical protein [Acinetobacter soli]|uniref:hypothetical protein n=1 Tax=Acinetobacter soli TaxID=487316 RepID=UPI00125EE224|nr:hypothetical protein [Acinetobacter soli]